MIAIFCSAFLLAEKSSNILPIIHILQIHFYELFGHYEIHKKVFKKLLKKQTNHFLDGWNNHTQLTSLDRAKQWKVKLLHLIFKYEARCIAGHICGIIGHFPTLTFGKFMESNFFLSGYTENCQKVKEYNVHWPLWLLI